MHRYASVQSNVFPCMCEFVYATTGPTAPLPELNKLSATSLDILDLWLCQPLHLPCGQPPVLRAAALLTRDRAAGASYSAWAMLRRGRHAALARHACARSPACLARLPCWHASPARMRATSGQTTRACSELGCRRAAPRTRRSMAGRARRSTCARTVPCVAPQRR